MSGPPLICAHCGHASPQGTRYCPVCGEPIDPQLVTTLRWLYTSLGDLDERIGRGEGERTLAQLRDDYRERYLELRASVPAAPAAAPVADAAPWPAPVSASVSATDVTPGPTPADAPAATAAPASPPEPRAVFSWRAFLAEQAIAIMAYMGGFLLLIATLSFEIGGWQALSLGVKLGAVCAVYAIFGLLGITFRRSERLRTVGGAYLAVFALLTPLLALGIYRFGLQAAGFSAAGMLCLSCFYAAIIYLALAWHTRFLTYAYLGWTAVIVGALAAVFWAQAPGASWLLALALASLVLLTPQLLHRFAWLARLEPPATQLASITTAVAICGIELYALSLLLAAFLNPAGPDSDLLAALAFAAVALVPLAFAWSVTLRRVLPRPADTNTLSLLVSMFDWLIAAFFAQASLAVAAWAGADHAAMAILLGVLALIEAGAVVALRARAGERLGLRGAIAWLSIALAASGALLVLAEPSLNAPLIFVLTAGILAAASFALTEREPLWLLASGVFLLFDYQAVLVGLLSAGALDRHLYGLESPWLSLPSYHALLVLALWLIAFGVGGPPATRRLTATVYTVAALDAFYVTGLLVGKDHTYTTLVLTLFALLALLGGLRERQPLVGNLLVGFFGLLATLPFTAGRETDGVVVALVALVPSVAALGIRRMFGLRWAYAPYIVAFWATLTVTSHLILTPDISTRGWIFLGISFAAWVLLAVAALATVAALWERFAWTMAVPAFLAFFALAVTPVSVSEAALVLVLVAVGFLLRAVRGRWWNVAWLVAALFGSILATPRLSDLGSAAPYWQVAFLLVLALATYLVAAQERRAEVTAIAAVYALVATALLPKPDNLIPTLVMFFAVAAISVVLQGRGGWRWAGALYAIEVGASVYAVARVAPYDAGTVEALLLLFATTTYTQAVLVRRPLLAIATPLYAMAAAKAQPDAHALLPLALVLATLGLLVGRRGGWRWSWPFYAAAFVAAGITALQGRDSPGFEGLALLALALVAYLVAAVEARPDILPLPLLMGSLALVAGLSWSESPAWVAILAFVALAWLYALGEWLWRAIPWLKSAPRGGWWTGVRPHSEGLARLDDPRAAGAWVHRVAGLLLGGGAIVVAPFATNTFTPQGPATQAQAVALVAVAALFVFLSRVEPLYIMRYVAGGLAALAVTWELRRLGADNIQAFILAPGSYLLMVGALLPADVRLKHPARLGQWVSLAGALLLMLPTIVQSFDGDQGWIYALVLAGEALVITAAGVGTRSRLLVLTGTAFVGLAAIRGALIAFDSGVPVALLIAGIAVLLMGGATWLSLRARHEAGAV